MRKVLSIVVGLLMLAVFIPPAQANVGPVQNWYVCGSAEIPVKPWGSGGAPTISFMHPRTQFSGYTFGTGAYIHLTDGQGSYSKRYVATRSVCPVSDTNVAGSWRVRAERALNRALALDDGNQPVAFYGRMAQAYGIRNGWESHQARKYLDKMISLQQDDGGYGLGRAWDAFGDGTVNDVDTSYTVTVSTHVGEAALLGFKAGVVEQSFVQGLVDHLSAMPNVLYDDKCMAYSDNPNDVQGGYCVHNVNIGAAVFLMQAAEAGLDVTQETQLRATNMMIHSMNAYVPRVSGWHYLTRTFKLSDSDHLAYQLDSLNKVYPQYARPFITQGLPADARRGEGYAVLASLDCFGSKNFFGEYDALYNKNVNNPDRMAYYGWNLTKAANACK